MTKETKDQCMRKKNCGKSGRLAIALALVVVFSAIAMVINQDSSEADPLEQKEVGNAADLVKWVQNDTTPYEIILTAEVIELDTTLVITKQILLTTNNGTVIKPSSNFTTNLDLVTHKDVPIGPTLIYVDDNNAAGLKSNKTIKGGALTIGKSANDAGSNVLTLDGGWYIDSDDKEHGCRVIYQDKGTLTMNSGIVTNGYQKRNGAGLFITNGAKLVMNGGEVRDNHIDRNSTPLDQNGNMYENPKWHYKYSETVLKFSADVWCSTSTEATINGGYIGKLFQNEDDAYEGKTILNNGTIGEVYVCNDSVRDTNNKHAKFIFNGGTVGHVYLATSGNAGNVEASYEYTEVMNPKEGDTYISASQVAQVGPYGFEDLQVAIDYAKDGDVIIIHKDITISSIPPIEKDITFRMAEKYVKPANAGDDFTSSPFVMTQPENLIYSVRIELNGGGVTVPAGWTDNGGILSKNYEYGTALSDIIAEFGEAPARLGYKFISWSYADGALGSVSSKIAVVYEAEDYDIHLHHGVKGFSHGKAKATFDGSSVSIHEAPVKIGHRLVGFFTHESGGTMVLNADGTFASDNVDDHVTEGKWSKSAHTTLYAQWELDESPGKGYLIEIVAMCALEALIVIGIAVIVRRR